MIPSMKRIKVYTDGACSGNPGDGGWAVILSYKDFEKEISGFEENTTNNRMELTAAVMALQLLKEPCDVSLYSDSAYLVNAFNEHWIFGWKKKNWKKGESDIPNKDLWILLYDLTRHHNVTFVKVKAHADNEFNNRCDKIAVREIKKHRYEEDAKNIECNCGAEMDGDI